VTFWSGTEKPPASRTCPFGRLAMTGKLRSTCVGSQAVQLAETGS
jgi:hypothetical protein